MCGAGVVRDRQAEPYRYAHRITADLADRCGGALRAAYLHGSAALGGWVTARSDVDLLFVTADDIEPASTAAAADVLVAAGSDCPGVGLEASIVTASDAQRPRPPWPFVLHVGDGRLVRGSELPGDADLIMHYATCRAAGIALLGPPPEEVIGPIDRDVILRNLADDLAWGLENASESYSVLNACRALVFCLEGRLVSKLAGGEAALARGSAPRQLVKEALQVQRGRIESRPPRAEAAAFVRDVAGQLLAARRGQGADLG